MKTPNDILHHGYSNPALEAEIAGEHQQCMTAAALAGRHHGKRNLPLAKGDNLMPYIEPIVSRYHRLIAKIRMVVLPDGSHTDGQMLAETASETCKGIEAKRTEIQAKIHSMELDLEEEGLEHEVAQAPKPKVKLSIAMRLLLAILFVSDTTFNASGLQIFGDSFIASLIISIGLTGAYYLVARYLGKHLRETPDISSPRSKLVIGINVGIGIAFAVCMAFLRNQYMSLETGWSSSPIILAILNLVLFVATAWVYYHIEKPEDKPDPQQEKLSKRLSELQALRAEDQALELQIATIKQELANDLRILLYKPEYCRSLIKKVEGLKGEAIAAFKQANLNRRSDRSVPDCFLHSTDPSDHYFSQTIDS